MMGAISCCRSGDHPKLVRLSSHSPKTAAGPNEVHAVQKRYPHSYVGSSRRGGETHVSWSLDLFCYSFCPRPLPTIDLDGHTSSHLRTSKSSHHTNMSSQTRPRTIVNFLEAQAGATHPARESSDRQPGRSSDPGFNPPESPTSKSSKKRRRSPEDHDLRTSNAELVSPKQAGIGGRTTLKARNESPWESYEEILDLNLDGAVTVAQRKAPHSGLVAIRVFPSVDAEKALYRHQHVKHDHIVSVLDAFTTEASLYIVLEHLPISLEQIVEGAKYPTEWQLAAILKQVRDGYH
jgi:hypothetical protein